jgi:inosine-uridine nucleoside N-ribohydrolase
MFVYLHVGHRKKSASLGNNMTPCWKDLLTQYSLSDSRLPLLLLFILLASLQGTITAQPSGSMEQAGKKIPVILDTDIGDDIDDTWALGLLLRSPELDLRLVTTDYLNTEYRARIVARLLEVAGRTDVPIGIGIKTGDAEGPQAPWIKDFDWSKYKGKVIKDGVQALIDTIMHSTQRVTIISIGPPPNLKAALDREPGIAQRASFVGMFGCVRRGYDGKTKPEPEWNVKCDVGASRRVLSAPWDITITPLDTCGLVRLEGKRYAAVRESKDPLIRAVIENYRIWCGKNPERADSASSTLFDTVAVYLAISRELLVMEELGIRVTDDGMTVADPGAKKMNCALDWKSLQAFEDFLTKRLSGK